MKRKVITGLIILSCFLLESTVLHSLTFASISPNLMLIITAAFGFMRGKKTGMTVGFICGLFVDLFWGSTLGFHMLIYTVIGYLNGTFERLFYDEDIKLPIILIAASEFIYGLIIYGCIFMLRGDFLFISSLPLNCILLSKNAKNNIVIIFPSSDGWNEKPPMESQFLAP